MRADTEETKEMSRNLVTEGRINDAARLLWQAARLEGLHRIVLHVCADGRVDIECIDSNGNNVGKTLHADTHADGALPSPGEALGQRLRAKE
jgi:hypothetical protein